MENNDFKMALPATLEKAADGSWKIRGLASTEDSDLQNEKILQRGMDLSPIDKKQGFLNWDHKTGPENLIGTLTGYKHTPQGLIIEGSLFKGHTRAKAVQEIMSSLTGPDSPKMGLSVEGKILKRNAQNPNIIEKCKIHAVALTMCPVNPSTHVDLAKSKQDTQDLMKSMATAEIEIDTARTFTSDEIVEILQKALGIGAGATGAPDLRTGGDALQVSNMRQQDEVAADANLNPGGDPKLKHATSQGDEKIRTETEKVSAAREKKTLTAKSLKPLSFELYKSNMIEILDQLQKLYPEYSRSEIWAAVSDRMERKFPQIRDI